MNVLPISSSLHEAEKERRKKETKLCRANASDWKLSVLVKIWDKCTDEQSAS